MALALGLGIGYILFSGDQPAPSSAVPVSESDAPAEGRGSQITVLRTADGPAAGPDLVARGAEPTPRVAAAYEGQFRFHYKQGYSFLKREVVDGKDESADVVFETCAGGISSITLTAPGGALSNLAVLRRALPEVKSPEALRRALVSADRGKLSLSGRASGDSRAAHDDVFLLRTRRGEWVRLAIVNRGQEGGWTEYLATVTYTLVQGAPIFDDADPDISVAGFNIDSATMTAQGEIARRKQAIADAAAEREREILERPIRKRLVELDERAAAVQATLRAREGGGAHVAAVLQRKYAKPLGRDAYVAATYSFEHVTRDDAKATGNDWDFLLSNWGNQLWLRVTTVTDDRSLIRDLGAIDFDTARRGDVPEGKGAEQVPAIVGHLYVIHTLDGGSDHWVLLQILEIDSNEAIVFRWETLEDPGALRAALIPDSKTLKEPVVRLQIRGGAGGGNPNRAFMDGTTNAYVDAISEEPLDFRKPLSSNERCRAYIKGGYVPAGQVFLIKEIEYTARADGDSNGHGEFILRVGPFVIAHLERNREARKAENRFVLRTMDRGSENITLADSPLRRTLSVPIAIVGDHEKNVYVEIANSSFADVVLRGEFTSAADAAKRGLLLSAQLNTRRATHTLDQLAKAENADSVLSYFDHYGAKVIPWLETVRASAQPGEYRGRLDAVLERLRAK